MAGGGGPGPGPGNSPVRLVFEILGILTTICTLLAFARDQISILVAGFVILAVLFLGYQISLHHRGNPRPPLPRIFALILIAICLIMTSVFVFKGHPGNPGANPSEGASPPQPSVTVSSTPKDAYLAESMVDTESCQPSCLHLTTPPDAPLIDGIAYPHSLYFDLSCTNRSSRQTASANIYLNRSYRSFHAIVGLGGAPDGIPVQFKVSDDDGERDLGIKNIVYGQHEYFSVAVDGIARIKLEIELSALDSSSPQCLSNRFQAVWGDILVSP